MKGNKKKRRYPKTNRKAKNQSASQFMPAQYERRFETQERLCEVIAFVCALLVSGMASHKVSLIWTIGIGLCAVIIAACFWLTDQELKRRHNSEENAKGMLLTPDTKPRPEALGPIPEDALAVFFGNSVAFTTMFPMTVIRVRDEDLFSINKVAGGLSISAKIFGPNGKIVVEINDNHVLLNEGNLWRTEKTPHRLRVLNDEARVVLDIEFLNPNTVMVLGDFYLREGIHFVIKPDRIERPGGTLRKYFFGNVRVVFMFGSSMSPSVNQ